MGGVEQIMKPQALLWSDSPSWIGRVMSGGLDLEYGRIVQTSALAHTAENQCVAEVLC